jgi:hypothetical protein
MSECEIIVKMDKHIKIKGGTYKQDLIRCKDCKHRQVKGEGMTHWYGCLWRGSCNDDDFCNYGERAEE